MIRRCGATLLILATVLLLAAAPAPLRTLSMAAGAVKTLDPILADDVVSRNLVAAVYDTLLQYDYTARPYRLTPSMLTAMPTASPDFRRYDFELRDDLFFAADPALAESDRKITSRDVVYSLMRIADARNHSPVYWMLRGKIAGVEEFHLRSKSASRGDQQIYDAGLPGLEIHDDRRFSIHLTKPDPRFLYLLAMPNAAVVPRKAVEKYGDMFARHPVGSGPFLVADWINDYRITLVRNPDYRLEHFAGAKTPADRHRRLPLLDRVDVRLIKQPMASWLLFLQGNLDFNELGKDNSDMIATGGELPEALRRRGIRLLRTPELEIRYLGFNFNDPQIGGNPQLRQALSLAYDIDRRVEYTGHQLLPANGPLPPGVAGYDADWRHPWRGPDLPAARDRLTAAGYPDGRDPASGTPLRLTLDQSGNTTAHRQYGELAAADFAAVGVELNSVLNNKPRFYEKLRQGRFQLFRLSWIGDYPDAENFLQLFYSGNIGSCNRTGFSDPAYDRLYEEILPMPDSPERTAKYREMVRLLADRCAWIYEGFPVSCLLLHAWLENYHPHDFAFSRLKYLTVDPEKRAKLRASFTPLTLKELQAPAPKPDQGGK